MRIVASHVLWVWLGVMLGKPVRKAVEKEKFWVPTKAFQYNHPDKDGGWGLGFLQSSERSVL